MAYGRIHDEAASNGKLLALSDAAWRMWGNGLIYCQVNLTDGSIPSHAIHTFGVRARNKAKVAAELCAPQIPGKAPLWVAVDGGFQIHDYLDWNDAAEIIKKKRADARSRYKRYLQRVNKRVGNEPITHDSGVDSGVDSVAPTTTTTTTRSQIRTEGVISRTEDGADTEESPPALWRRLWDARWPEGICRTSHAEMTELERLAVDLGRAEVVARVGRYFATSDDWLLEHKHPLRTFLRQINSYETPVSEREPAVLKRLLWRAVGQDGRMWLEAASVTRTGACVRLETSVPDKLAPYHDTFLEAVREELGGDVELAIVAAEEGGA